MTVDACYVDVSGGDHGSDGDGVCLCVYMGVGFPSFCFTGMR